MATQDLRIPCTDENAAQRFHTWLLSEGIEDVHSDGREVFVSTDNPGFAYAVAEQAVDNGFADDDEAARAAHNFEIGWMS
jgi:hypothetical protein